MYLHVFNKLSHIQCICVFWHLSWELLYEIFEKNFGQLTMNLSSCSLAVSGNPPIWVDEMRFPSRSERCRSRSWSSPVKDLASRRASFICLNLLADFFCTFSQSSLTSPSFLLIGVSRPCSVARTFVPASLTESTLSRWASTSFCMI